MNGSKREWQMNKCMNNQKSQEYTCWQIEKSKGLRQRNKDGWGEKKSEGRKDAWDRLMSDRQTDRQTDRQIDKHMDHWTDGGLKERKTKRKNWGCGKTRLRNLEKIFLVYKIFGHKRTILTGSKGEKFWVWVEGIFDTMMNSATKSWLNPQNHGSS